MQRQFLFIILFLSITLRGIPQVEISFIQTISDNFIESDLFQEVNFIPLQFEKIIPPDLDLRYENHNFFILDSKSKLDNNSTQCVYRFSEEGVLINTINQQKKEESENNLPFLNNPVKFNVNPYLEQVEIFNFENSTLQRFSFSGKKIDQITFPINPADFTRDPDGNYWIYTGWNNRENQYRLLKTDKNGKIVDKKMRLVSKCTPVESPSFSNSNTGIHFWELLGNSTFYISGNSITETYFLNYGTKNLSPLFHSMNPSDSYQSITHNGYFTVKKYLENDHFAYFSVNFNSSDGREVFHVIYDKKIKKTFKYIEDAAIGTFDKALALTDNDELVFLTSPPENKAIIRKYDRLSTTSLY